MKKDKPAGKIAAEFKESMKVSGDKQSIAGEKKAIAADKATLKADQAK